MTETAGGALGTLRRCAYLGARYGPRWWLRRSPGPIGAIAWALARGHRKSVEQHLGWVLGRTPSQSEVRETFVNFAHCLAESLAVEGHTSVLRAEVPSAVQALMADGSACILITAHTGAWELAAKALRDSFGREVVLVMRAEDNAGARAVHERVRRQSGVRFEYVGRDPLVALRLSETLGQGGLVAFQLDRPPASGRSLPTRLFGRPWSVPEGPLRLARQSGAPIVSAFAAREGFLEHRLELQPPLTLTRDASDECLRETAQILVSRFEEFVARHPRQWFQFDAQSLGPPILGFPSTRG